MKKIEYKKDETKNKYTPSRKMFVLISEKRHWKPIFRGAEIINHLKKKRHGRSKARVN